jgi:hypothetical protein
VEYHLAKLLCFLCMRAIRSLWMSCNFFWESILFVLKIELQPQQARLVILSYLRILHEGKIFEGNTNRKYYNFSILWDPFN